MPNPQFKMSADTRFLVQYLSKIKEGVVVSYADMTKEIGTNIHGGTPALQSAKRVLMRDRIIFDAVRGVGIKRLAEAEILKSTDSELRSIRNKARKGTKKLSSIEDFDALAPRDQLSYLTKSAAFAVMEEVGSERGMKKIEQASTGRASQLSIRQSLEAFLKP